MKKTINLLIAFIGFFAASAQLSHKSTAWHAGVLFLRSGLEMHGQVSYDPMTEVVQFKNAGMIKAFTSHQVQSFHFTEEQYGIMREFTTYEVREGSRPAGHPFFEVVLTGPLMVVRKIANLKEWRISSAKEQEQSSLPTFDYENNFVYYVYHAGKFLNMKRFKKAIFPLMDEYKQQLSQYIQQRAMTPNCNIGHQIRLINEYNFLKTGTQVSQVL